MLADELVSWRTVLGVGFLEEESVILRQFRHAAGLERRSVLFGLATALTAWIAFAVASMLHVQNAFWAPMAVWIVAQSTRGMLLERGAYRIAGTIAGAIVGFALLHAGLPPLVAIILVSLWAAGCSALTHLLRESFTYVPMMAGLTASVVLMPTINAIDQTSALAMARVVSTIIGVICVSLLGLLLIPASPRRAFLDRVRGIAGDALMLAARFLERRTVSEAPRSAHDILDELAEVEQQASTVNAGSSKRSRRIRLVNAFVAASMGLMAAARALAIRMDMQGAGDATTLYELIEALKRASSELKTPAANGDSAIGTLDRALVLATRIDARFASALRELLAAEQAVTALTEDSIPRNLFLEAAKLLPRRDWRSASIAAAATGLATCFAGLLVLYSGWSQAWLAALGICTFTMLMAMMDQPQLIAPKMMQGIAIGVVMAALFRFFLLPHADSLLDILLMLAPVMLLGGLARASRFKAQAMEANMCFLLGSQPFVGVATDPASILSSCGALVMSIVVVGSAYRLLPRDPQRRAQYTASLILRDVERLCGEGGGSGSHLWRARMSRRMLRLMMHAGRAKQLRDMDLNGVLGAMNLAHAITDIREALADDRRTLSVPQRQALQDAIDALRTLTHNPQHAVATLETSREKIMEGGPGVWLTQAFFALRDCAGLLALASGKEEAKSRHDNPQ